MQTVYAHRGASGYAPENTLEAFALAAKQGAFGVELDTHLSRDGVIMVTHDERIDRVSTGTGLVRDMTCAELKQFSFGKLFPDYQSATIPTLREVYELLGPTGLHVNVELKNSVFEYEGMERACIELAEEMGMADRVMYSSFNHYSLLRVKEINPRIPCGILYSCKLVRPWEYAAALKMDALHPHQSELRVPGECEKAHARGLMVNPWTVNEEEDIRFAVKAGVDRIITNYPDRALRVIQSLQ